MGPNGVSVVSNAVVPGIDDGASLLEALALEPSAVVYDLADGRGRARELSTTFDAVDAYLSLWSGTPLLVHVPDESRAAELRAHPLARRVTIWPTLPRALAAAQRHRALDRSTVDLDPVLSAPRAARDLIDRTLAGWHAPQFANDAKLVLTEMVTNAVVHAGTAMTVSISRHRRTQAVRVAVRDLSSAPAVLDSRPDPMMPGARGLWIVGGIAQGWDSIPLSRGKIVWAVLVPALDGRPIDRGLRRRIW